VKQGAVQRRKAAVKHDPLTERRAAVVAARGPMTPWSGRSRIDLLHTMLTDVYSQQDGWMLESRLTSAGHTYVLPEIQAEYARLTETGEVERFAVFCASCKTNGIPLANGITPAHVKLWDLRIDLDQLWDQQPHAPNAIHAQ
jgi:hypothetical protein